jgi:hypothetical protein
MSRGLEKAAHSDGTPPVDYANPLTTQLLAPIRDPENRKNRLRVAARPIDLTDGFTMEALTWDADPPTGAPLNESSFADPGVVIVLVNITEFAAFGVCSAGAGWRGRDANARSACQIGVDSERHQWSDSADGLCLSFPLADGQPEFLCQEGEEVDESEEDDVGWADGQIPVICNPKPNEGGDTAEQ